MSNDKKANDGPPRNPLFEPLPAYATPPVINDQIVRANRRKAGRIHASGVLTSLGELVDLSIGGMKLRCGRAAAPVGSTVTCNIVSVEGQFEVFARVVRVKRISLFNCEVGVEFVNLTEQTKACLIHLAKTFAADNTAVRIARAA